jgi:hypothetical protein
MGLRSRLVKLSRKAAGPTLRTVIPLVGHVILPLLTQISPIPIDVIPIWIVLLLLLRAREKRRHRSARSSPSRHSPPSSPSSNSSGG